MFFRVIAAIGIPAFAVFLYVKFNQGIDDQFKIQKIDAEIEKEEFDRDFAAFNKRGINPKLDMSEKRINELREQKKLYEENYQNHKQSENVVADAADQDIIRLFKESK